MAVRARDRTGVMLAAGGALLSLLALAAVIALGGAAWRAWLAAAVFWAGIPAGALMLAWIIRLIPGPWGAALLPLSEAGAALLPLAAIAFLPILFALGGLYGWTHQGQETGFRAVYLSRAGYIVRTVVWFATLGGLGWASLRRPQRGKALACVGLVVFLVLNTFTATDWLASLDSHFNASGFGLYLTSIEILTALAAGVVLAVRRTPEATTILGRLLLTLVLIWGYLAFMQYFIIWSDNLSPSAAWYLRHSQGGLGWMMVAAATLHLAPGFLLLLGPMRRNGRWLTWLAAAIILGSLLELAWIALPPAGLLQLLPYPFAVAGLGLLAAGAWRPVLARRTAA